MPPKNNQSVARPIFRWLAVLPCCVFLYIGVTSAFPQFAPWDGEASVSKVLFSAGLAVFFGSIAVTGKFKTGGKQRVQLLIAAKKYANDQITLEEYGSCTKEILNGE